MSRYGDEMVVKGRAQMGYFAQQGMMRHEVQDLENADFTPNDRPGGDHYAHAAGRICKKCDRRIEAGQPARRRGETGWAHDVCPLLAD